MVCLIQHRDVNVGEVAVTLLDQVFESAGAGQNNVDTTVEGVDLWLLVDATEDRAGLESGSSGQRSEGRFYLDHEFTRRRQDQCARAASAGSRAVAEPRDQRQQEGIGLARAGAAAAEHIAPGERIGQGGCLNGGGRFNTEVGKNGI